MTTFQEPPLQSRRAARQGDRVDVALGIPSEQAASNPNAEPTIVGPASSTAPGASAPLAPEPLNYATTSRPPLPQYNGQSLRPRRSHEAPGHAEVPPSGAVPVQDPQSYRPKDYSPDATRSAASRWAPQDEGTVEFHTQSRDQVLGGQPVADAPAPVSSDRVPVPEGTITRRELRALREANAMAAAPTDRTFLVPPAGFEADRAASSPVGTHTGAHVAQAPVDTTTASAPVAPPALIEPVALVAPPAPHPSTRLDSALAEFDALASGRGFSVPDVDTPAPLPGRRAAQQAVPVEQSPAPVVPLDAAQPPHSTTETETTGTAAQAAPVDDDGPSRFDALFAASRDGLPDPVIEAEAEADDTGSAPERAVVSQSAPPVAEPPVSAFTVFPTAVGSPAPEPTASPSSGPSSVGHWSTQSDIDDAEQVNETTISRSVGVGNGAITTSALVMPSVPESTIGGPMNSNGEILLTGSISLPQSLSMTGAHPSQLDESDLDHLLDPGDQQVSNTDSTPVLATSAVSTHTATSGMIAPQKPKGTRGFTALIIAASVMAVVVVGLLVAGLVSGTL